MPADPICNVCGEPRSAHVATVKGPLTHPREARGEGRYELASYWEGFDFGTGSWRRDENYRFVPAAKRWGVWIEVSGDYVEPHWLPHDERTAIWTGSEDEAKKRAHGVGVAVEYTGV